MHIVENDPTGDLLLRTRVGMISNILHKDEVGITGFEVLFQHLQEKGQLL